MRQLIDSGSPFEEQIAYSREVADGEWVFVSGTTVRLLDKVDYGGHRRAGRALRASLLQAGASLADVVRVTYIVTDTAEFEQCWPVPRRHCDSVRLAATMISEKLMDPRMRIEIKVMVRRRREAPEALT